MTEANIRQRFHNERTMYDAWGAHVTEKLKGLIEENVDSDDLGDLFKVPPGHRVKDEDTLVGKALYRNKGYEDPYNDITDKVGTRFVVQLQRQVRKIRDLVKAVEGWEAEKSRDYEEERRKHPVRFEYQSIHFIVRPSSALEIDGASPVPAGTPCEVQIRTLLQHAHSELTHNTVYKPRLIATPEVKRAVAKSMALVEATGDVFGEVAKQVRDMNKQHEYILERLREVYRTFAEPDYQKGINDFLIDALHPLLEDLPSFDLDDVENFYAREESAYIRERIQDRKDESLLFRQPIILLVFYLAEKYKYRLPKHWPLTNNDLEGIYSYLGKSLSAIQGRQRV